MEQNNYKCSTTNLLGLVTLSSVLVLSSGQIADNIALSEVKSKNVIYTKSKPEVDLLWVNYQIRPQIEKLYSREQYEFINNNEGLDGLLQQAIGTLQSMFDNFSYSLELTNDPTEDYEQICINIKSSDDDSFEKFAEFVDNWLVQKTESLEHINFDLV
jgi:hypothetical protein